AKDRQRRVIAVSFTEERRLLLRPVGSSNGYLDLPRTSATVVRERVEGAAAFPDEDKRQPHGASFSLERAQSPPSQENRSRIGPLPWSLRGCPRRTWPAETA